MFLTYRMTSAEPNLPKGLKIGQPHPVLNIYLLIKSFSVRYHLPYLEMSLGLQIFATVNTGNIFFLNLTIQR